MASRPTAAYYQLAIPFYTRSRWKVAKKENERRQREKKKEGLSNIKKLIDPGYKFRCVLIFFFFFSFSLAKSQESVWLFVSTNLFFLARADRSSARRTVYSSRAPNASHLRDGRDANRVARRFYVEDCSLMFILGAHSRQPIVFYSFPFDDELRRFAGYFMRTINHH